MPTGKDFSFSFLPHMTCISTLALHRSNALCDLFCCIHEDICTLGLPIVLSPLLTPIQAVMQCSSCLSEKSHPASTGSLQALPQLVTHGISISLLVKAAAVKSSCCQIKLLLIKLLSNQAAVKSSCCQTQLLKRRLGCRLWAGWQRRGQPQSRP